MESDATSILRLPSTLLDAISMRLQELASINADVPALAYSGTVDRGPNGCGCKGGCDGGCTSW